MSRPIATVLAALPQTPCALAACILYQEMWGGRGWPPHDTESF